MGQGNKYLSRFFIKHVQREGTRNTKRGGDVVTAQAGNHTVPKKIKWGVVRGEVQTSQTQALKHSIIIHNCVETKILQEVDGFYFFRIFNFFPAGFAVGERG